MERVSLIELCRTTVLACFCSLICKEKYIIMEGKKRKEKDIGTLG